MEIITGLIENKGISVVMATHFLNQAYYLENAGVKTSVALMNESIFECVGSPTDVLTPENLKNVFRIKAKVASDDGDGRKFILVHGLQNVENNEESNN